MVDHFEHHRRTRLIWAACLIAPQLLAIASTAFRLIYRKRNQGLWWDDHLALICLALASIFFVTPWLALTQVYPTPHIVAGWLFTLLFPTLVWATRISLALSIARIVPRQHPIFFPVLCLVSFFGAIYLALVIQLAVACGRNTSWTNAPPYIYIPTRSTAIFILCGDLVGDILLITIPLCLFWNAKLRRVELFLVKIGFAASVLTSASSIICAVFFLIPAPPSLNKMTVETSLTHILVSFSLMACNALVIITFLYRYFRRQEGQPSISVKTSTTYDQYPLTHTSDTMPSNLPSSSLTNISETVGGRHTFSCGPHPFLERPHETFL